MSSIPHTGNLPLLEGAVKRFFGQEDDGTCQDALRAVDQFGSSVVVNADFGEYALDIEGFAVFKEDEKGRQEVESACLLI